MEIGECVQQQRRMDSFAVKERVGVMVGSHNSIIKEKRDSVGPPLLKETAKSEAF